jgi:hypothetical protein
VNFYNSFSFKRLLEIFVINRIEKKVEIFNYLNIDITFILNFAFINILFCIYNR